MAKTSTSPSKRSYGPFELILDTRGTMGVVYTPRFVDSTETEFEAFRNDPRLRKNPFFIPLLDKLNALVNFDGFRANNFKNSIEDGYDGTIGYLSKWEGRTRGKLQVRLYAIRLSDDIVILGRGCIKAGPGPLEDYNGCPRAFYALEYVHEVVAQALEEGIIQIDDSVPELSGPLTFKGRNP